MSRKVTRRFINREKIKLRHEQQLPEPAEEMTADVVYCGPSSHMELSLPVNARQEIAFSSKHEEIEKLASPEDPFKNDYKQLQDFDYFDTDTSSWDQSGASFISWSDEIESVTTERVQKLMDDVECILYDEPVENPPSREIIEECAMWKEAFPHMRVRGHTIKMSVKTEDEENCRSNTEEEIFAIHGVVQGSWNDSVLKEKGSQPETVGARCGDMAITEESKTCQLDDKVKKHVVQQLASFVLSEVIKQIVPKTECHNSTSKMKWGCSTHSAHKEIYDKNSVSPGRLTPVSSDSESEMNPFRIVSSKSLNSHKERLLKPEVCVWSNVACSSPPLFHFRNQNMEYPSFSVIGSAPVSLPPPRIVNSSIYESRSFHSAAERNKNQHIDRRFSCGNANQERSSNRLLGAAERNQTRGIVHKTTKNGKQFPVSDSEDKLNKHSVLPPIKKMQSHKVSPFHKQPRALSVNGVGFSKTELFEGPVAREPVVKPVHMNKVEKGKKELRLKKSSYQ